MFFWIFRYLREEKEDFEEASIWWFNYEISLRLSYRLASPTQPICCSPSIHSEFRSMIFDAILFLDHSRYVLRLIIKLGKYHIPIIYDRLKQSKRTMKNTTVHIDIVYFIHESWYVICILCVLNSKYIQ